MSKAQTFPELLTEAIETWYDNDSDFARKAGVKSPSSVSRWKAGLSVPSVQMLRQIAPHLHTSARLLIAMCYGTEADVATPATPPPAVVHPLAKEVDRLLGEKSGLSDQEKSTLRTVVDSVLAPYRRRRTRKSA